MDFLGIGAQKAGTTWLWTMLRTHPDVWMPPRKELHWFDRATSYPSPSFLVGDRPIERFLGRAPHHRLFRAHCRHHLSRAWRQRDWPAFRWYCRFYFGTYDDAWYLALFAAGGDAIRGEITPAYAILDEPDVARIHRLQPRLKIIFLLRNPIERAWSQARHDWTRGALADIDNFAHVRAFIDSPAQERRSDYLRTLSLWEAYFPKDQMLIGFFDDITRRPGELLAGALRFLGLDPAVAADAEGLHTPLHVSTTKAMPTEVRRYLEHKYAPAIAALAARFGGPAAEWADAIGRSGESRAPA
jgi:hypothetical protein